MLSNSIILSCYFIFQNTKNPNGQVKYLVYCMENAILNLPHGQDQMVWLIDFAGFNLGNLSIQVTKMTADVLQGHYPERLGVAILYNAPKFFEPFWKVCLYNSFLFISSDMYDDMFHEYIMSWPISFTFLYVDSSKRLE